MNDFIAWAFERWPFAVFVLAALGFLYYGLITDTGPSAIRPVSAQTMQTQITSAKNEVLNSNSATQQRLKEIGDKQDTMERRQLAEARDSLEQKLLWWRQQNCKSKGPARNYTWKTMGDLKDRYRDLTNTEWPMPECKDIGAE